MRPEIEDCLKLAIRAARGAVDISRAWMGGAATTFKADGSVVTALDKAIQDHVVGEILRTFPDHAICAEETTSKGVGSNPPARTRYCWVIDPLDGTRNFALGFPCFATAIAVLEGGVVMAAVVHEHRQGGVYTALRGQGAWLDGKPMRVFDAPEGGDFLVGVPSTKDELTVKVLRHFVTVPGMVTRNVGVSNVHLAFVASGALSGAFNKRAKIWDVAPGALLVTEAGGRVTTPFGEPIDSFDLSADPDEDVPFIAGAPRTHQRLIKLVREAIG